VLEKFLPEVKISVEEDTTIPEQHSKIIRITGIGLDNSSK